MEETSLKYKGSSLNKWKSCTFQGDHIVSWAETVIFLGESGTLAHIIVLTGTENVFNENKVSYTLNCSVLTQDRVQFRDFMAAVLNF